MISQKQAADFDKRLLKEFGKGVQLDGILNLDGYNSTSPKILWILKEGNYGEEYLWNTDSDEMISDAELEQEYQESREQMKYYKNVTTYPRWRATFARICYVTYGAITGVERYDDMPDIDASARIDGKYYLDNIAFINVKKVPGGSVADNKLIAESYSKHRAFLQAQIDFINPDIIFECSGVKQLRDDLADSNPRENKRLLVNYYHPAYRFINNEDYVNAALRLLKEQKSLNQ